MENGICFIRPVIGGRRSRCGRKSVISCVWRSRKCGRNIIKVRLGELESQACADVTYQNGVYHMFFCYRNHTDFRNNPENSYRIGYARSLDLTHWERDDDRAGIERSQEPGNQDSEMVAYPHVFVCDGKTYMLYLGNEVGKCGFLLAELKGELA